MHCRFVITIFFLFLSDAPKGCRLHFWTSVWQFERCNRLGLWSVYWLLGVGTEELLALHKAVCQLQCVCKLCVCRLTRRRRWPRSCWHSTRQSIRCRSKKRNWLTAIIKSLRSRHSLHLYSIYVSHSAVGGVRWGGVGSCLAPDHCHTYM